MVKQRFKKIHVLTSVVFFALFIASSCVGRQNVETNTTTSPEANDGAEKRGAEIVAEYLKRDAAPYRRMKVRFTIKTEGEPEKIYEVDNWRKQTAEGTTTLTQI